jgi:hypothetical protein
MGWFPPAAILFCLRKSGNASQVKLQSTLGQQKIKCFVLNSFSERGQLSGLLLNLQPGESAGRGLVLPPFPL